MANNLVRTSWRERLRLLGTRLLPHDTQGTTCPPAPLTAGEGPTIIVASIMRSGTHLLLDSLFNNFRELKRAPLFVDFDAYERALLPPGPLNSVQGVTIKTHFPHTPLAGPYAASLAAVATRALVLRPVRPAEQVRGSLAKWGHIHSVAEFAELEARCDAFWAPFSPVSVEFSTLLEPAGIESLLKLISTRTHLTRTRKEPVMPAAGRLGVYRDKMLTRVLGRRAPRINTTIGYRLAPRQRA